MAKYDNINQIISDKIYKYRCDHPVNNNPMTLLDVSNQIDISRFVLSDLMNGKSTPSLTNMLLIADFLNCPLDELAGRTVKP